MAVGMLNDLETYSCRRRTSARTFSIATLRSDLPTNVELLLTLALEGHSSVMSEAKESTCCLQPQATRTRSPTAKAC